MSITLTLNATSTAFADDKSANIVYARLTDGPLAVANTALLFSLTGNAHFTSGINIISALTDSQGEVQLPFFDAQAETVTVSAYDAAHTLTAQASSTFTRQTPSDPERLQVEASSGAAPDGSARNTVKVRLTDAQNNPLSHRIIDLSVDKHAHFTQNAGSQLSVITQKGGIGEAYITSEVAETVTVNAVSLDDSGNIRARGSAQSRFGALPHPYQLTLHAKSGAHADGKESNSITAALTHRDDNRPLPHVIIDLQAIGHARFTESGESTLSVVTQKDGTASASLTNTRPESVIVAASYRYHEGSEKALAVAHFVPELTYTLTLDATSGAASNGIEKNEVTVSIVSNEGTALANTPVTISVDGNARFENDAQSVTVLTDAEGHAAAWLNDTANETVTLTAVAHYNNTPLSDSTQCAFREKTYSVTVSIPPTINRKGEYYIALRGLLNGEFQNDDPVVKHFTVACQHAYFPDYSAPGNENYDGAGNKGTNLLNLRIQGESARQATIDVDVTFVDGQHFTHRYTTAIED